MGRRLRRGLRDGERDRGRGEEGDDAGPRPLPGGHRSRSSSRRAHTPTTPATTGRKETTAPVAQTHSPTLPRRRARSPLPWEPVEDAFGHPVRFPLPESAGRPPVQTRCRTAADARRRRAATRAVAARRRAPFAATSRRTTVSLMDAPRSSSPPLRRRRVYFFSPWRASRITLASRLSSSSVRSCLLRARWVATARSSDPSKKVWITWRSARSPVRVRSRRGA